jgi:menaquinone-dependent protoporphyrinogen oxidase
MKTAIIYATNHGCTDKCAHNLADELKPGTDVFNIEMNQNIDLNNFKTIIIGGSIHMGSINKKIKKFINNNIDELCKKDMGLFICCMYEGNKAIEQFNEAFPENLRNKALAHGFFGGEFNFEKMNFFEKAIVKKVANVEKSVSNINYTNIKDFAEKFKK